MHLPIIERDELVLAALRLIRAEHYAEDADPNADAEAEYATDLFATRARAFVAALAVPDERPAPPAEFVTPPDRRAAFIRALFDLAEFLTDHPDVPVERCSETLTVGARGENDAQKRAFVDAAARAMGVETTGTTHYGAKVEFGPLAYEVLAISAQVMEDYHERTRLGEQAFAARHTARGAAA